jgi:ABC-2 type transport system permease protein
MRPTGVWKPEVLWDSLLGLALLGIVIFGFGFGFWRFKRQFG